ncbi:MAG: ABC transporter substrate-binding protein [Candidatus Latescibacterota bacterium]
MSRLLSAAVCLLTSACLAACGGSSPDQGGAPAGLKRVPRNRTLVMDCAEHGTCLGQIKDYNTFNPYLPGTTSRIGYNFLYEPLYFYNPYRDELIPWIATGHEYSPDHTALTVTIRPGVQWSDGADWTAHDLVFTIEMLKASAPDLSFSTDMDNWVARTVAVDSLTARIELKAPNPRFLFSYFVHYFGNGVPIVPRHIWEGRDPRTFTNFDPENGLPVFSGPYALALSVPEQRVWDLRPDWWAARISFQRLPKVERVIYLTYMEEAKRVQNLIGNTMDTCLDLRPPNIRTVLERNPNVTTWTGRELPHGYLDYWPVSLGFNALEEPFADPEIRRAVNHAIDREQLIEVGWQGSGTYTLHPFPDYPPLLEYTQGIGDLFDRYEVGVHSPEKTAAIMARQGFERDGQGFWSKDGTRLKMVVDIFDIFQDLAPVLVAQLRRAGFDASFRMTPDVYTRMAQGEARAFMNGQSGSVRDPYDTLRLYHSRFVQPTGTPAEHFWRWRNAEFDALVDRMAEVAPDDPRLAGLFRQAMEIWLCELPSIPLVQWYHRIPHNQTYWTGWPSAEDPYINSAYWHAVWLLVLLNLEPVQG